MSALPPDPGWQAFEDAYARGLSVIPGMRGKKLPYVAWKSYQMRRPTRIEVVSWKQLFPSINPLVVTGKLSEIIILDQDGPEASNTTATLGGVPPTVTTLTPRSKFNKHYWFKYPVELGDIRSFAGGYNHDLKSIDLRAEGGLAVLAGSVNHDGRPYTFEEGHALGEIEIADLRQCLWLYAYIEAHNAKLAIQAAEWQARLEADEQLRAFRKDSIVLQLRQANGDDNYRARLIRYAEVARDRQLEKLATSSPGTRNAQLNRLAFALAPFLNEGIWSEPELERALEQAAIQAGLAKDPNCGLSGIRRTIASGLRAGRRNLIHLPDRFIGRAKP